MSTNCTCIHTPEVDAEVVLHASYCPAAADRLTPQREAETVARADRRMEKCRKRGQASLADLECTKNEVHELAAELAALRAERDCLAMAVLFARQWSGGTPFELHKGIDEILATMPNGQAGETA